MKRSKRQKKIDGMKMKGVCKLVYGRIHEYARKAGVLVWSLEHRLIDCGHGLRTIHVMLDKHGVRQADWWPGTSKAIVGGLTVKGVQSFLQLCDIVMRRL